MALKGLWISKTIAILQNVKPKYAVSGHIHQYKKEQSQGITLIRLGSVHNSTQFYDMIEL
jgi:Icc-related predicted phosphoesterase